jgi:hypothetical protein
VGGECHDAAAGAVEHRRANLALEFSDCHAHCRLRAKDALGRTLDTSLFYHRDEHFQLV